MVTNGRATIDVEHRISGNTASRKYGSKMLKEVEMAADQAAAATVNLGLTKNLGNFQSLRVDVSVTLPTPADTVEDAIQEAKKLAETYLHKFTRDALEEIEGPKKVDWQ